MSRIPRRIRLSREDLQMCHNKVFYAMLKVLDDYTDKLWQFPLDIEDPFKASMPYPRHSTRLCESVISRMHRRLTTSFWTAYMMTLQ